MLCLYRLTVNANASLGNQHGLQFTRNDLISGFYELSIHKNGSGDVTENERATSAAFDERKNETGEQRLQVLPTKDTMEAMFVSSYGQQKLSDRPPHKATHLQLCDDVSSLNLWALEPYKNKWPTFSALETKFHVASLVFYRVDQPERYSLGLCYVETSDVSLFRSEQLRFGEDKRRRPDEVRITLYLFLNDRWIHR